MMRVFLLTLVSALALGGCSRLGSFNPLNWFGGPTVLETPSRATMRPLVRADQVVVVPDSRRPIAGIEEVAFERTPDGGILRATGLAEAQGYYNAELVRTGTESGIALYEFRVSAPPVLSQVGPERTRRISVAEELDADELARLGGFRVIGASNSREIRR